MYFLIYYLSELYLINCQSYLDLMYKQIVDYIGVYQLRPLSDGLDLHGDILLFVY